MLPLLCSLQFSPPHLQVRFLSRSATAGSDAGAKLSFQQLPRVSSRGAWLLIIDYWSAGSIGQHLETAYLTAFGALLATSVPAVFWYLHRARPPTPNGRVAAASECKCRRISAPAVEAGCLTLETHRLHR